MSMTCSRRSSTIGNPLCQKKTVAAAFECSGSGGTSGQRNSASRSHNYVGHNCITSGQRNSASRSATGHPPSRSFSAERKEKFAGELLLICCDPLGRGPMWRCRYGIQKEYMKQLHFGHVIYLVEGDPKSCLRGNAAADTSSQGPQSSGMALRSVPNKYKSCHKCNCAINTIVP